VTVDELVEPSASTDLTPEVDPAEVGMDADRLDRIDRHFARYVDDGRLAGWLAVVSRGGRIVHVGLHGQRDAESGAPVRPDTLWRIYSMTKPITSVAAMMLVEQGLIELTDPIARFLPEFDAPRVYQGGSDLKPVTVPATEPIRLWHLLTHTAGLTYGFHRVHPVDAIYRRRGYEWGVPRDVDLAGACRAWADMPLLFQPGAEWNYSVATDVLGRVVEVVSGQPLDRYFEERILRPLRMTDTGFVAADPERLAALYSPDPRTGRIARNETMGGARSARFLSGGGGLVSSAADYHRFTQMLLRGGELDGVRLLGSRTLAAMTRNQLPGNADLYQFGRPVFAESPMVGQGFGLGFSVLIDTASAKTLSTLGEFAWGGAASTAFWVDPVERLSVVFMTQLLPSSTYTLRAQLHQLVHQAIVD
jgi:CubicO group peptidase (beta-lactamase class C family)